jgi:hypothetical protein
LTQSSKLKAAFGNEGRFFLLAKPCRRTAASVGSDGGFANDARSGWMRIFQSKN